VSEILPGSFAWSWRSGRHRDDLNGAFVAHRGGDPCSDPVEPEPPARDRLAQQGAARILLTNQNHVRASRSVRCLREPDFDAALGADGVFVRGGGRERLRELVAMPAPG
jgi:hypothetical protein